jgi:hypothetical protein
MNPSASANAAPSQPRPIRFVTNNDGPYAKRRRINSACLTCRRKKTRCSGERPICGTCTQNNHECAGYGDDTSPTDTTKNGKKAAARASFSGNAPAATIKQEGAPKPSQASEPSSVAQTPQHDGDNGMLSACLGRNRATRLTATGRASLTLSTRNRMPYFRYFGPTAIMPGFKQMVVKVRGKSHGTGHTTSDRTWHCSTL